jgi:3-oxoacyl-[acyl-carrier protein] reductase
VIATDAARWPSLKGKRVLVTGASSGIGAAAAAVMGAQEAWVGIHFRQNEAGATVVAEQVRAAGGRVLLLDGDLCVPDERDRLVARFVAEWNGIDVLVNNAGGVSTYADFTELEETDWDDTMDINAKAPLWLSRAVWPHMVAQHCGRIINVSSAAVGYGGSAKGVHYTASKAALEGVTAALAREGAKSNILVNAVRSGLIATGMHRRISGYSEEQFLHRASLVPLGRPGDPYEVAATIAFLASREGGFITGQVIAVAGGD